MPKDSIKFANNDRDYDIFSNAVELGIRFWLDDKEYQSHSIEAAFYGIQGYIPHDGYSKNDNYEDTPTRAQAEQIITSEYSSILKVQHSKHQFEANVPDYFHLPIRPDERSIVAVPQQLDITLKEQFMYELLLMKATQNVEVLKALLNTQQKELIAESQQIQDKETLFWEGQTNALGKTWMRVRETLQNELQQHEKIKIRSEFSSGLTSYFFSLDLAKSTSQASEEEQFIDKEKIRNQPELLTTAQIQKDRHHKSFEDYEKDSSDVEYKCYDLADLIIYKSRLPPNPEEFPLHAAAYAGNTQVIKKMLTDGFDPNVLDRGGYFSQEDIALVDPDIRGQISHFTAEGRSPLYLACSKASVVLEGKNPYIGTPDSAEPHPNTYVETVRLLLENKANPLIRRKDENSSMVYTPIHWAIQNGNYKVTKLFREYKSPNGKNYMQNFLEHYGCQFRDQFDCEYVKYPDTKKSIFLGGYSLLFQAAQDGDIEMIHDIFNYAKDFNEKSAKHSFFNSSKTTPLLAEKNKKIRDYLNTEKSDQPYDYILHAAVKSANLEVIKLFVEKGADITKTNRDDKTPMDLAHELGYSEIYDYLHEIQDNMSKNSSCIIS